MLMVLALSAAHFHWHTGRVGLISENGSLNYMFGRCHAERVQSNPDGKGHGTVHFRPPPYLQMREHDRKFPTAKIQMFPALGYDVEYTGYIGDAAAHAELVRKCIEKTGWWGQVKYGMLNLAMLWHFNIPWPDSGKHHWRGASTWWQRQHEAYFMIPTLLALGFLLRPRQYPKQAVVALHLLALMIVAVMYFGDTRQRTAFDPVLLFLSFEVYGLVAVWLWGRVSPWVLPRLPPGMRAWSGPSPSQPSSSG
jgi:hypothetical protein